MTREDLALDPFFFARKLRDRDRLQVVVQAGKMGYTKSHADYSAEVSLMRTWKGLTVVAAAMAALAVARGHHSVSGVFDSERPFEINGVVTEVEWINPHIYLHLAVTEEDGSVTPWQLETAPTAFMRKAGITKAMLEGNGTPVTVTGIESHTLPNVGWIRRITFEDGRYFQISAS